MESEIILIEKSWAKSTIEDAVIFGGLAGLLYLNHACFGENWLLNLFFVVLVFLFLLGRSSKFVKKFYSREEAIRFLSSSEKTK